MSSRNISGPHCSRAGDIQPSFCATFERDGEIITEIIWKTIHSLRENQWEIIFVGLALEDSVLGVWHLGNNSHRNFPFGIVCKSSFELMQQGFWGRPHYGPGPGLSCRHVNDVTGFCCLSWIPGERGVFPRVLVGIYPLNFRYWVNFR